MAETISINGLEVTYFGGSSFFISGGDAAVCFDPLGIDDEFGKNNDANVVLISHVDGKNVTDEDILKIGNSETVIYGAQIVEDTIGPAVKVLAEGDELEQAGMKIKAVPAYVEGDSTYTREKGFGFEVEIAGKRVYYAGATSLIPGMRDRDAIDVSFLPIGGEPFMDYRDAADSLSMIETKVVIPMNYDTGIDSPADNFRAAVSGKAEVIIMHG